MSQRCTGTQLLRSQAKPFEQSESLVQATQAAVVTSQTKPASSQSAFVPQGPSPKPPW
jgi:hypothetical protein